MVERLIDRPRPIAMRDNRFLKRLRKKAKKGLRGWPLATIAFYGPNLSQATKAAVGIIPSENAEAEEIRDWHVLHGDIREDVSISQEIVEFIKIRGALSVVMADGYNWLPSPRGNRLPRRMVPCLRVLAWTRSLYGADASLIRAASGRGIFVKILQGGARDFDKRSLVRERAASKLFRCYGRDRGFESVSLQQPVCLSSEP
jgi:hypothetical protein